VVTASGDSDVFAVPHPATGVYCLAVDPARWALVTSTEAGRAVAADTYRPDEVADPPCGADTTVRVTVSDASGPADGGFNVLVRQ